MTPIFPIPGPPPQGSLKEAWEREGEEWREPTPSHRADRSAAAWMGGGCRCGAIDSDRIDFAPEGNVCRCAGGGVGACGWRMGVRGILAVGAEGTDIYF